MDMKWIAYVHDIAWTAADGTPLGGFAYTYDVVGRITARRHALGTNRFDRAYAYDDLDRLAADGSVSYAYDALGRRVTSTTTVGRSSRISTKTATSSAPTSGARGSTSCLP